MIKKIRIKKTSEERVRVSFTIPEGYKYKCLREPQNLDTYIPSDQCFVDNKPIALYDSVNMEINKEGKYEMKDIKYLGKKRFIIEKTKAETIGIWFDKEVEIEVNIPEKYELAEKRPRLPNKKSDIFIAQDNYDDGISKEFGNFGEFKLGKIYNISKSGFYVPHDVPILGKKRFIIKLKKVRYQLLMNNIKGEMKPVDNQWQSYSRKSDAKRRQKKLMNNGFGGHQFTIKEIYE